jgi:hypothetical protein
MERFNMKNKSVILRKDITPNIPTFPEVFRKGTVGEKVLVIDKENGLFLIEIKLKNRVYLYAINESDFRSLKGCD